MQIISRGARNDLENMFDVGKCLLEEPHRLVIFKVPDMLAQDRITPFGQAESVLQLPTEREHLFQFDSQIDGLRHEPAGAAQHTFLSLEGTNDRIIHSRGNVAVVQQEPVRDAAKLQHRLVVGNDDWLLAQVAAGHYQGRELGLRFGRIAE